MASSVVATLTWIPARPHWLWRIWQVFSTVVSVVHDRVNLMGPCWAS